VTQKRPTKRPSQAEEEDDEVIITLERTICFGSCPAYSLMIFSDGRVMYQGNSYVRVQGKKKYNIAKQKVKHLIDEFHKEDYFNLKDTYEPIATDGPCCITFISINGHTKRVAHWPLSMAPRSLDELEEKIDETAGTAKFVKLEENYKSEPAI